MSVFLIQRINFQAALLKSHFKEYIFAFLGPSQFKKWDSVSILLFPLSQYPIDKTEVKASRLLSGKILIQNI